MITASRLAGTLGAHAMWSLHDGDHLIPILGFSGEDGQMNMQRLVFEDRSEAVAHGRSQLDANPMDANDAVLVYDGRITLAQGKFDALIIELRSYFMPGAKATYAIPYGRAAGGFAVHKPKIVQWVQCDDFAIGAALESFHAGVQEHAEGAKIWSSCLDESV